MSGNGLFRFVQFGIVRIERKFYLFCAGRVEFRIWAIVPIRCIWRRRSWRSNFHVFQQFRCLRDFNKRYWWQPYVFCRFRSLRAVESLCIRFFWLPFFPLCFSLLKILLGVDSRQWRNNLMLFCKMCWQAFVWAGIASGRVGLEVMKELRIFRNLIFSISSNKFFP